MITYTTIKNLRTAHTIRGEGDALLLLHGWGANIGLVWPLAERLMPYGYQVHALDMPGFGESETPAQAWTIFDYADFVLAYMDAQNLEQVYLFGHSFGGRIGLILGSEHPERIQKMALADSAGVRPQAPLIPRLRLTLYKKIRNLLENMGATPLADTLRQRYNQRYGSTDFQQVSGVMRDTFVNIVNQDLTDYAARVQVSTLLFWGDKDEDTPLSQGKLLEKTIPDAGLIVYEGAGHYSYLERPGETARIMNHFFKQD